MEKILVVDDNPSRLDSLMLALKDEFSVDIVLSGNDALERIDTGYIGYIVDIHLEDYSGDQLIYDIKKRTHRPTFFCAITGKGFEESLLKFSNSYIDDFLSKDATALENKNRILRVFKSLKEKKNKPNEYSYKGFCINLDKVQVTCEESILNVTLIEFKILSYLIKTLPERDYFPKDQLVASIWNNVCVEERTLNTHVSNLNKKLIKFKYKVKCKRRKGFIIESSIS